MDDAPAFVPVVAEPCHEAIPAPKANGCGTITMEIGGTIVRAEPADISSLPNPVCDAAAQATAALITPGSLHRGFRSPRYSARNGEDKDNNAAA